MRVAHPPTCPHAECKGKTFTAQKGLRAHMKIHEQRNVEVELQAALAENTLDSDNELPKKRRRGGEVDRRAAVQGTATKCDGRSSHQSVGIWKGRR